MTQAQKAKLLARSGIASKLMEMLAVAPSDSSQGVRELKAIVGKQQKRVEGEKVREFYLPEDIEALFQKQEAGLISFAAGITKGKAAGAKLLSLVEYTETFARCGFGCLGLVEKCMANNPFEVYLSDGPGEEIQQQDKDKSKSLLLMMNMTQAEENYIKATSFWSNKSWFSTTMNFGRTKHEKFVLPELTETCMMRLEGIDGISRMRSDTRPAGMGYKRRNQFEVFFEGVDGEKRFTEAVKGQYNAKIKSEILPKVRKLAEDLKPKMLARGEEMRKSLVASMTPEQESLYLTAKEEKDSKRFG
jgi:hypothetical protein